ncbi:outer membrane beta-barrel protein [Microvirga tunisiensis]|uniref:Outer membrane beta-barrel protein n=2 Tax=Pannonibacter tanglangensis TaxID=2750084 RepID=A0ABW9ZEM8_9HYPH|nr:MULTISPECIES: outer membrane protein [unclassified Pannonibacter]NBN63290.1 outer membrane beta-barrel protein [Pannonibacter sp. XCT-34]NBN76929.1 outer membrane beta-barrel protein [Pannonibacter sp. XCT-53]
MKSLAAAGASLAVLAALSGQAIAADLPQSSFPANDYSAPVDSSRFDWSGFYFGGNLGWSWAEFSHRSNPTGKFNARGDGVTFGVHGGYNHEIFPNFIAGVEADLQYADLEKRRSSNNVSVRASSNWNGSLRGRLGVTFDRFMVYGTGGLAIADLTVRAPTGKHDATQLGWTVGAGVEGAVTDKVTARLEYLYADYGRDSFNLGPVRYRTETTTSTLRAGVSYKF